MHASSKQPQVLSIKFLKLNNFQHSLSIRPYSFAGESGLLFLHHASLCQRVDELTTAHQSTVFLFFLPATLQNSTLPLARNQSIDFFDTGKCGQQLLALFSMFATIHVLPYSFGCAFHPQRIIGIAFDSKQCRTHWPVAEQNALKRVNISEDSTVKSHKHICMDAKPCLDRRRMCPYLVSKMHCQAHASYNKPLHLSLIGIHYHQLISASVRGRLSSTNECLHSVCR